VWLGQKHLFPFFVNSSIRKLIAQLFGNLDSETRIRDLFVGNISIREPPFSISGPPPTRSKSEPGWHSQKVSLEVPWPASDVQFHYPAEPGLEGH